MQIAEIPSVVRMHSNAPEHGASGPHSRMQMPPEPQRPDMQSSPPAQSSPTTPRAGAQTLAPPASVQLKPSGHGVPSEQKVVHQLTA